MTSDFFTARSSLLPYVFVWEKCWEFQTTSPLEPLGQCCSNFIWSLPGVGEWKSAKIFAVRWPRWPPCPYMVKTFNNLLLQNRECLQAESLHKSSGTGGLPKSLKWWLYIVIWPFTVRSNLLPHAFVWAPYTYMSKLNSNIKNKLQSAWPERLFGWTTSSLSVCTQCIMPKTQDFFKSLKVCNSFGHVWSSNTWEYTSLPERIA